MTSSFLRIAGLPGGVSLLDPSWSSACDLVLLIPDGVLEDAIEELGPLIIGLPLDWSLVEEDADAFDVLVVAASLPLLSN